MSDSELIKELIEVGDHLTRRFDGALSIIKGISYSEYQILAALRDHPSDAVTRVDLAGAVGLSASGVTRALKPMEKLGFIETTRDARDARKSLAKLTDQGVELVTDADGVLDDAIERFGGLSTLSTKERQVLAAAIDVLASA